MAQITLYVDDETQSRLRETAARRGVSQSQFVAELIRQATAEVWPAEVLALAGSSSDFQLADALRAGMAQDAERSGP